MTDKQIIIDEIDVSGCKYMAIAPITPKCSINDWTHCDGQNCYYKQLKHKEQECEELKKWKETVVELFERTCRCKYLNEENNHCSFYNRKCIGAINQCLYKNQQTLTEIKEIIEQGVKIHDDIIVSKQILQKISDVEN